MVWCSRCCRARELTADAGTRIIDPCCPRLRYARTPAHSIDVPIECAGVRIESGDLIFGDVDGVVVVPRRVEDDVIARALGKVSSENVTRDELLRGAKLKDVYDRYGVL